MKIKDFKDVTIGYEKIKIWHDKPIYKWISMGKEIILYEGTVKNISNKALNKEIVEIGTMYPSRERATISIEVKYE